MDKIQDLVFKGHSLMESGKFDDALGLFVQALLLNQDYPDIWNFKGIDLIRFGIYEEEMECFNKSLKIDPIDKNESLFL